MDQPERSYILQKKYPYLGQLYYSQSWHYNWYEYVHKEDIGHSWILIRKQLPTAKHFQRYHQKLLYLLYTIHYHLQSGVFLTTHNRTVNNMA